VVLGASEGCVWVGVSGVSAWESGRGGREGEGEGCPGYASVCEEVQVEGGECGVVFEGYRMTPRT